jgi:pyruvate kinase
VRILVTCPSESADNPGFFTAVATAGADAVRINCAHDDAAAWRAMIARGEMADAAMAARAECVMLNKGPFVTGAV